MGSQTGVTSVVVTYKPDLAIFARLIERLTPQVDAVVIVDNDDGKQLADWLEKNPNPNLILLPLGTNRGIAAAQNVGIEWARAHHSHYVLLLDHDSLPRPDMVDHLITTMKKKKALGEKVGMVGPRFVDYRYPEHNNAPHFICLSGCRFRRAAFTIGDDSPIPVDFLIASGSLIPLSVFDDVGLMNEQIFIDHVDTEFSLRLKQSGYRCYGVPAAIMEHSIGDMAQPRFGRMVPMHSAVRHYYIIRNAVWIIGRPWMKPSWRIALGTNSLRRFIYYSLFSVPRYQHIRMMLRGFWHGIIGKLGQIDQKTP